MCRRVEAADITRGLPFVVGVGIRYVSSLVEAPALYPGEEAALGARAMPERRVQYALGRAAGRDALAGLGMDPVAIGRGLGGEPLWPDGVVGSISHTRDVAVAVVGRSGEYLGLGVDVEQLGRGLDARIARLVARPAEMRWVNPEAGLDRLVMLFSAKEAVFKALFPLDQIWFGFTDAELRWDTERRVFVAELMKGLGEMHPVGFRMDVMCTVGDGWVVSTAFVVAPRPASPDML